MVVHYLVWLFKIVFVIYLSMHLIKHNILIIIIKQKDYNQMYVNILMILTIKLNINVI